MRNLLFTTGLVLAVGACTEGAGTLKDPPVLRVTSPTRSLVQSGTGQITVTGVVTPNAEGDLVEKVLVNDVQATVDAEGNFSAIITVAPGATLIRTVARDAKGGEARDTRAVQAGELRAAGANIDNAMAIAISADSFAKIAAAGGPIVKGMDFGAMLSPLNPMVRAGDEAGPDCLYGHLSILDVKMSDFDLTLIPVDGGLELRAEIRGLDVPGHADYAVACADGSNDIRVLADRVVIGGTLLVSPKDSGGFETTLASPNVEINGLDIQASGLPGDILNLLNIESSIEGVLAKGAEMAMEPMMNSAMGALAGPKTLPILGHNLTVEVSPAEITFDVTGGLVVMNGSMLMEGAESAKFVYTENGRPDLDFSKGFQLGLADDLINEMLAEAHAVGMLNLSMPQHGGPFDTVAIQMTLPPMISADPTDGKLRVILGDMAATFLTDGEAVAKASLNAKMDVKIVPSETGSGISVQLGEPEIFVNVLDDIENTTRLPNDVIEAAVPAGIKSQINAMSGLLRAVPMPAVAGLQMIDLSVGSDQGFVMVEGAFR